MTDLMRPEDLKKVASDAAMKQAEESKKLEKIKEEEKKSLHEIFMTKEIHPQAGERINNVVRRAAENGLHEVQVLTFAAAYCSDKGRRINNTESDWPDSLEGHAKKAYDYFEKELRPLGYKLRVQVLDYNSGVPGNIGFFLRW